MCTHTRWPWGSQIQKACIRRPSVIHKTTTGRCRTGANANGRKHALLRYNSFFCVRKRNILLRKRIKQGPNSRTGSESEIMPEPSSTSRTWTTGVRERAALGPTTASYSALSLPLFSLWKLCSCAREREALGPTTASCFALSLPLYKPTKNLYPCVVSALPPLLPQKQTHQSGPPPSLLLLLFLLLRLLLL